MKNKIIGFVAGILCSVFFIGCTAAVSAGTNFGFTEKDSYSLFSIRVCDKISDYVDNETGVHYFAIFDDASLNALCPRYNADGTLMVE